MLLAKVEIHACQKRLHKVQSFMSYKEICLNDICRRDSFIVLCLLLSNFEKTSKEDPSEETNETTEVAKPITEYPPTPGSGSSLIFGSLHLLVLITIQFILG